MSSDARADADAADRAYELKMLGAFEKCPEREKFVQELEKFAQLARAIAEEWERNKRLSDGGACFDVLNSYKNQIKLFLARLEASVNPNLRCEDGTLRFAPETCCHILIDTLCNQWTLCEDPARYMRIANTLYAWKNPLAPESDLFLPF